MRTEIVGAEPDNPINSSPVQVEVATDNSHPVVSPPLLLDDSFMTELFRLEVEAQVTTLTNGLLQEADDIHVALADTLDEPIATQYRVVRVSAENLNRMMGLAGESMIEANWLNPFIDSLMLLKFRQLKLAKCLEKLQLDTLVSRSLNPENMTLLEIARRKEQECRDLTGDRITELEGFVRRTASLSDRLYR